MKYEKELNAAIEAGLEAKKAVLKYYYSFFDVEIKSDNSPVTSADKESDKIIRDYLSIRFPNYAFLTEESIDNKERLNNDYVWIIDPIDGTEDYIKHDDEFTINIALCYKHKIVVGVVLIPAKNLIYFASQDNGSYVFIDGISKKIRVNDNIEDLKAYVSRSHFRDDEKEIINKNKSIKTIESVGSSIKACYIANGYGELTFRTSDGTKEWDTAAFQIIVEEAGGLVLKWDKTPITYNREDVYNRGGYVVLNRIENFPIR